MIETFQYIIGLIANDRKVNKSSEDRHFRKEDAKAEFADFYKKFSEGIDTLNKLHMGDTMHNHQ